MFLFFLKQHITLYTFQRNKTTDDDSVTNVAMLRCDTGEWSGFFCVPLYTPTADEQKASPGNQAALCRALLPASDARSFNLLNVNCRFILI